MRLNDGCQSEGEAVIFILADGPKATAEVKDFIVKRVLARYGRWHYEPGDVFIELWAHAGYRLRRMHEAGSIGGVKDLNGRWLWFLHNEWEG